MKTKLVLFLLFLIILCSNNTFFQVSENISSSPDLIIRSGSKETYGIKSLDSLSTGVPITAVNPPESLLINSTIPINIVFVGFDESLLDIPQINSSLTHWYAPIIQYPSDYAGANYSLDINYFMSNATTLENDFLTYLASVATWGSPPADLLAYDAGASGAYTIPADGAISWLDNNINNYFGNINNSYCLYLIDTYTWRYITSYYYYSMYFPDPDTGIESNEKLTILYGGEYPNRGVFLDLSAGPVNYQETRLDESNEGVSVNSIPPIWDYTFPQDKAKFNNNLTEYIQETIDLVYTPSYIYEPVIKDQYEMMVYLIDNTSTGIVYNDPLTYIRPSIVNKSLEDLIPYANWNTSYYVDYLSNHPSLQQVIKNAYDVTNHITDPYAINPDQSIIDYLDANRQEFGMTANTIPVFLFAWDEYLYFGSESLLARATADENGNALMVIGGYNPAYYSSHGYSQLVIHEVGHMLGLRHPHDGISWDRYNDTGIAFFSDWLRDFIATPMTYAHQCYTFSTFDYDSLDRGHIIERLNSTWNDLYQANNSLLTNGYQYLDPTLETMLNWVLENHTLATQYFSQLDYEEAFYYMNLTYISARDYNNYATSLPNFIPTLVSPSNGSSSTNNVTTLEWTTVASATEYRVIIATNMLLNSPTINTTSIITSFITTELPDNTYYWAVQAKDSNNNWGALSEIQTFIIMTEETTTTSSPPTSSMPSTTETTTETTTPTAETSSKSSPPTDTFSSTITTSPGYTIIMVSGLMAALGIIMLGRRRKT